MVVSIPCDIRKDSFKDSFFEMNKFPMKKPITLCKFYDNKGTTQLLLRFDHFINMTVGYLVFGVNFLTSILVIISYYKCKNFCKFGDSEGATHLLLRSNHFVSSTV